jgi:7-cyano-7-deazaguanine synthase
MTSAILLSGGMDSTALAFWKRPDIAFTIDYGQIPAEGEIRAARQIAYEIGIQHEVIVVDCSGLGSGDLAGKPASSEAPVSEWWPFRNQLLITLSAMRAVMLGVNEILIGSVASDNIHIDGTKEFFHQLDQCVALQEGHIRVSAPAIDLTSAKLIKISQIPISLLSWAHSCHKAEYACGQCRGCYKHQNVMAELGYEPY